MRNKDFNEIKKGWPDGQSKWKIELEKDFVLRPQCHLDMSSYHLPNFGIIDNARSKNRTIFCFWVVFKPDQTEEAPSDVASV